MPRYTRCLVHRNGPALWPERRSLTETLRLRDTTPPHIWLSKYQGVPTSPHGTVFKRSWWNNKNRFDPSDGNLVRKAIRRWITWDTAGSTAATAAYSCGIVLEMQPDYRVFVRQVVRHQWGFTDLVPAVERLAEYWRGIDGGKTLAAIIIEEKSTGGPALSTLRANAPAWMSGMLWGFDPQESKELRAHRVSTWCQRDCVWLPHPHDAVPWLFDFEDELYDFPESAYADQIDAFSQGLWMLHPHIERGYWARKEYAERAKEQRRMLEMARG